MINKLGTHPQLIQRTDALLVSINDRLAGQPGQAIEPLSNEWLLDTVDAQIQESEDIKKSQDDLEEQIDKSNSYRNLTY